MSAPVQETSAAAPTGAPAAGADKGDYLDQAVSMATGKSGHATVRSFLFVHGSRSFVWLLTLRH